MHREAQATATHTALGYLSDIEAKRTGYRRRYCCPMQLSRLVHGQRRALSRVSLVYRGRPQSELPRPRSGREISSVRQAKSGRAIARPSLGPMLSDGEGALALSTTRFRYSSQKLHWRIVQKGSFAPAPWPVHRPRSQKIPTVSD